MDRVFNHMYFPILPILIAALGVEVVWLSHGLPLWRRASLAILVGSIVWVALFILSASIMAEVPPKPWTPKPNYIYIVDVQVN